MVDFWAEDVVYRNPVTGNLVNGKKEVSHEFSSMVHNLGDMNIEIETIRFPYEDKAVEEGTITVNRPGKEPIKREFKMSHIKKGDRWLITNVNKLDLTDLDPEQEKK